MPHKSYTVIEKELESAKKLVKVGGIYSHFKNPKHMVKVVSLGTQEATDKMCVIYHDIANPGVLFVRDLDDWLEKPLKDTPRFKPVVDKTNRRLEQTVK